MQAVEDLLTNQVQAKQAHYKSLDILPADSMDKDEWMSMVDHKYLTSSPSNQAPSDKEKKENNIIHGTDDALALKVNDDGKAHSPTPEVDGEGKTVLVTPPSTKGINPKKKAKK